MSDQGIRALGNLTSLLFFSLFVLLSPVSAEDQYNDYFAAGRDEQLLRNVERYHIRSEQFWQNYKGGRFKLALSDVDFVLRYFPNHPQALMLVGSIASLVKNHALAIFYYEKALNLYPQYAVTRAQYGRYLTAIDRVDEGIAQLKKALEIDSNLVTAYVWLAEAYHKSGDLELSRKAAEEARGLGYKGKLSE
jgi:tetratricopeptide (TPR) repeat protein